MKPRLILLLIVALSIQAASGAVTVISKVPYVIKKPGKYIVSTNLSLSDRAVVPPGYFAGNPPAGAGISIAASDVDLDLSGFSLTGNDAAVNFTWAIFVFSGSRIRIHNGSIIGFKSVFNHDFSASGIVFEDLRVHTSTEGISLTADNSYVRRCAFSFTGPGGNCLSVGSTGTTLSIFIEGCSFSSPGPLSGQDGISIGGGSAWVTVRDCSFSTLHLGVGGNAKTSIANCLFTNCTTKYSGGPNAAGFNQ